MAWVAVAVMANIATKKNIESQKGKQRVEKANHHSINIITKSSFDPEKGLIQKVITYNNHI